MRLTMLEATSAAAVVFMGTGCDSGGISRQEFYDRAEELQADMFAGAGGEAVREHRELLARVPDGPLRDSAAALVREIEGLFDEVIDLRNEILERTPPGPEIDWRTALMRLVVTSEERRDAEAARNAERRADALDAAAERRSGEWQEIRAALEGETMEEVVTGMERAPGEKARLGRWLETDRQTLARVREESEAQREAEQDRPPPPEPEEEPTAPAQPEAGRERAEPAAEKRGEVARPPSAAEPEWRVTAAGRSAGRAKARLEREIEEARATLARIGGEGVHRRGNGPDGPFLGAFEAGGAATVRTLADGTLGTASPGPHNASVASGVGTVDELHSRRP